MAPRWNRWVCYGSRSGSHRLTRFFATAAGFRTPLALFGMVLGALVGAGVAHGCTEATNVPTELRVAAAKRRTQPAESRAVQTDAQAIDHLTAGGRATLRGARLALLSTGHTLVDAFLVGFICHSRSPFGFAPPV